MSWCGSEISYNCLFEIESVEIDFGFPLIDDDE